MEYNTYIHREDVTGKVESVYASTTYTQTMSIYIRIYLSRIEPTSQKESNCIKMGERYCKCS